VAGHWLAFLGLALSECLVEFFVELRSFARANCWWLSFAMYRRFGFIIVFPLDV
jgi:hypothetical protein